MTTPFGKAALVCNMARASVTKALPVIRDSLQQRGIEYEVMPTMGPKHACELARRAVEDGLRLIVAVGGDGTIHEVVNGMIVDDHAINPDAALGVIAAGTGSDFIKTFGLPSSPSVACAHIDGPDSFPIDIGKVTLQRDRLTDVRYFANIAEAGLGADVVARASKLPRWLGPTVYFFAFWMSIIGFKPSRVQVDLVDRSYDGLMNNLVVANGQFFGGGMKVAPKAAPTDGLLDIQIEHARKREAIALMPKIYKGEHVPHPDIEEAKRIKASIQADRPLRVEADGEVIGYTPATFELLRDALRLKV